MIPPSSLLPSFRTVRHILNAASADSLQLYGPVLGLALHSSRHRAFQRVFCDSQFEVKE